jgi:stage II sporulation protein D
MAVPCPYNYTFSMKIIRVGLTVPGSLNLERDAVTIYAAEPALLTAFGSEVCPQIGNSSDLKSIPLPANREIVVSARDGKICCDGLTGSPSTFDRWLVMYTNGSSDKLLLKDRNNVHAYHGKFIVGADSNKIRLILECNLEDYIKGVLGGEMPASYELEALKAQAIAARTYALKPRIDHSKDYCNVCDSFLCCQCFVGITNLQSERQREAIAATSSQVLTYNQAPLLALFSACAGGHTENYDFCFSNLTTNAFPDQPLPYLQGVPEGKGAESIFHQDPEAAIKHLWQASAPETYDSWSKHFRWQVSLSAQSLESHMHSVVEGMLSDPKQAPFVLPPPSAIFGHIQSFEIERRGVAGTAMIMSAKTSKGTWQFKKELIIRSIFKNPEAGLKRLASARIFFEHHYDNNGLLADLKIFGLGSGHGVGMQQDGAEGMARMKKSYRQILSHYYTGSQIENV